MIYLDLENSEYVESQNRSKVVQSVLKIWEQRGYDAGIYATPDKRIALDRETPSLREYDAFYARKQTKNIKNQIDYDDGSSYLELEIDGEVYETNTGGKSSKKSL